MSSRRVFRSLSVGLILGGGVLVGSPACSGSPSFDSGGDGSGGGSGACVIDDKSLCGVTCDGDGDCAAGLFCDPATDTCQAECIAGEAASSHCDGAACSDRGRCMGGDGSGGTPSGSGGGFNPPPGSGGGGGMGGGDNCIDVEVTPTPIIPNVVLLIDRSLSMTDAEGYGDLVDAAITAGEYTPWECEGDEDWRWNVVRTVLFNPDDGVVTTLGEAVRFGMTTYSANNAQFDVCPVLTDVAVDFANRDAMLAAFECSDLIQETPTRESLGPTADALAALDVEGPKFIVLATDGLPDNCDVCPNFAPQPGAPPECGQDEQIVEQEAVVAEAARIHDELGITLDVIDVSSPDEEALAAHLEDVALAGGGSKYDGTDPAGLIDAFNDIISEAQSCVIELNGMVVAGEEDNGKVVMDGEELVYEEDWIMPMPNQIELVGDACATYKAESPTLAITFPCDDFIVVK